MKDEILEALRQEPGLRGVVITDEFPETGKPQGIGRPV